MEELITFDSKIKLLDKFEANKDVIKNEPMFFNCDFEFAYDTGGSITKSFLDKLPEDWKSSPLVFDSRVHMLMPGWYPAIPGYHHDDVPREKIINPGEHFITAGQPNYTNPEYKSEHILGLVNSDICPTSFILGKCSLPKPKKGELVYRNWHFILEDKIKSGEVESVNAPDCQLVYFDCDAFHSGNKAIKNGWRWFGRVSRNTERCVHTTNEIRNQVQVYLEFPMQGW